MRQRMLSVGLAVVLMAVGSARAQQVENPRYRAWTKFGVGSSVTLESDIDAGAMKIVSLTTEKLTEKTDDHATIEITMAMTVMGQDRSVPPHTETIPAKTEKKDLTEIGTEEVEAAGKKFDCKVYEDNTPTTKPQGAGGKGKLWASTEVPGGMVKMELKTARGVITSLLKSFEVK